MHSHLLQFMECLVLGMLSYFIYFLKIPMHSCFCFLKTLVELMEFLFYFSSNHLEFMYFLLFDKPPLNYNIFNLYFLSASR